MPIWDEFSGFFKTMRVYLLGRGLLSLLIMGAVALTGSVGTAVSLPVIGLVAAGGLALSAGMRLYNQAVYEDEMTDLYCEDIAIHLGIDPRAVTRTHLKIAAKENEVIAQALTRQRHINIVSFVTSALAAAATFGLLYFGLAHQAISDFFTANVSNATLANFLQWGSIGIVSSISSLVLHNGLEEAIGHGTGLSKAVAHDLIAAMDRDVKRGRSISPEQVYGVLVAEDATLKQSIATRFGERFSKMNPQEQRATMDALGVTADMTEIANIITQGKVPPGRLAYMIHYSHPAKKAQATEQAPVPTRSNHVERLGLTPRDEARSYVERLVQQQNLAPALAPAGR